MRTGAAKANLPLFGKADTSDKFNPTATSVILEGDSEETLKTVPDGSVKLIVTSPPYNLGKSYEEATHLEAYLDNLTPLVDQLIRVLADDGSLCWQVGNYVEESEIFPLDIFYYPFFRKRGLKLRNRVVWHFEHGLHCSKRFSGRYEVLLGDPAQPEVYFPRTQFVSNSSFPSELRRGYADVQHERGPDLPLPESRLRLRNSSHKNFDGSREQPKMLLRN